MARVMFVDLELRNEKLGPMYLAAALKQRGHEALLCRHDQEPADAVLSAFRPDFLAFSLTTGLHRRLLELAAELKRRFGIKVIVGGPHATFFAEHIPEESADFVVVGQGEQALADIVEGRVRDRVVTYALQDLDQIPFPDRALFYRFPEFADNPMKNIITFRDCPYSCSYCFNHSWKKMFQKQPHFMQRRSVDNVIAEARALKQDYPLEKIIFIDDNFIFNDAWIEEFCDKYSRNIGLPFLCCLRVNLLTEKKLQLLKNAGLVMINFALESADPQVQKEILNRGNIENEQVINAIALFRKYNIKSRMQNMIGLPLKESYADALNTLRFNKMHKVEDSWVSIFQPYPGTELGRYSVQHGFIGNDLEAASAESFFDESRLQIDRRDQINRLQKWWYFIIRHDFSDRLVDLLLQIEIPEAAARALQLLRFDCSKRYLYDIRDQTGALLEHDWEAITGRFGQAPAFPLWTPVLKKYKISTRLSGILMELPVPAVLAAELMSAP